MLEDWLAVCAEVVDFQEVEVAILVLQKVAHEHVHRAFFFGVDVGLREDLVDRLDGGDRVWVGVWHALDLYAVVVAIAVDREQVL